MRRFNKTLLKKPYWASKASEVPYHDFTKELHPPKTNKIFPRGVVGIRMDDDFWMVAALPWKYHWLSTEELTKMLWPEITDATFPFVYRKPI